MSEQTGANLDDWQDEWPTLGLKFVDGKLHQAWGVKISSNRYRHEWRPVPSESTQPQEQGGR